MTPSFLSGSWSDITAFNYAIDPIALRPFVPHGTELDFHQGKTYLSVVALQFEKPKLFGFLPIPCHSRFPMITFRFYVKRLRRDGSYDRGTVFIKEFSPRTSVQSFSRLLGKHDIKYQPVAARVHPGTNYFYRWGRLSENNWLEASVSGEPVMTSEGMLADYIFEKPFDFVPLRSRHTLQYQAVHPRWKVWTATNAEAHINVTNRLPCDISQRLRNPPDSVFVAIGSRVQMKLPKIIYPYPRILTRRPHGEIDTAHDFTLGTQVRKSVVS